MLLYCVKNTPYNIIEICGFLVGYGCGTEPEQGKWKVTLPEKKQSLTAVVPPQPGEQQLKIIHITDQHVDSDYKAGSPSGCDEPLCCHVDSPAGSSKMLGGEYGGSLYCDLSMRTMELMLDHVKSQCENPDIIILSGDQPAHDVWTETPASHMQANAAVINMMKEKFPNASVFPAIGNHDTAPVNNFPMRTSQIPQQYHTDGFYNEMAELWRSWLSPMSVETVRKGGYYSQATKFPGLRIISVNNNVCCFINFWQLINCTDPMNQLSWLVTELSAAEDNNEKVIIILHIPPGCDDCVRVWSSNYYDIVNRFHRIIVAHLSGHTHVDHFMLFYDYVTGLPINVNYVCPSMTPYEYFNLAYRIMTVDGTPYGSYDMLDHNTYMMDLAQSNANGNPQFSCLYSARDAYGMESLQPSEWDKVIKKIETNITVWNQFLRYYHRNCSVFPECDQSCKKAIICQLRSGKSRDPSQCLDF